MAALSSPPTDGSSAHDSGRPFGRFRLLQLLGRSEHSMAWLAFDPRVAHEVMLTMPRVQPADAQGLIDWQERVKTASRLSHPHLAHVIEVGVESHWPYVIVDRALGVTLEEWLSAHPVPSPLETVGWLCQALEGLAFAHEAGVAHGHVEAYTLLVGENGLLRWMGLGVGSDASQAGLIDGRNQLDPRTLQAQRAAAACDVLSVGVLLHRLLTGQMPLGQAEISTTLKRLPPQGSDQLRLTRTTPQPVSEALRAIANRATAGQDRQRYLNARTFLRALEGWRESETQGLGGPLNVLMDRLSSVGHLPSRIPVGRSTAQWGRWEAQRNDEIAEQILHDMGLTLEMLRQVNSAQVQGSQGAGSAPVITVRRAIALMGINGVRRSSLALRDWPGPLSEPAAALLLAAMDRVRLAGAVAQLLAPAGYDPEVVYTVNLLQNLGRLLVHYHFADEAEQIRHLMRPVPPLEPGLLGQPGLPETTAAFGVLGIAIETLGAMVAKHWGLGDDVQHMMHRLPLGHPVRAPDTDIDWLRIVASSANEVVDSVTLLPADQLAAALAAVAQRYARVLSVDARALHDALNHARDLVRKGKLIARSDPMLSPTPPAGSEPAGGVSPDGSPTQAELNHGSLRERLLAKATRSE